MTNGNSKPGTTSRTRYVPVFSIEPEASRGFLQMLCGKEVDRGETVVEDATLYLEAIAGENAHAAAIKESLKKADAAILLVRFLDTLSINQLREIYQSLPDENFLPRSLLIFRQKGEVEFKMSCASCGQKLDRSAPFKTMARNATMKYLAGTTNVTAWIAAGMLAIGKTNPERIIVGRNETSTAS